MFWKTFKKVPLVRAVLYDTSDGVIFGRITFSHFGCLHGIIPPPQMNMIMHLRLYSMMHTNQKNEDNDRK